MTTDISIIIPTLNSGKILGSCLKSISQQTFPFNYEILISDGGSADNTLKIAKKYQAKIIKNTLKTAEAGKAIAIKHAKGRFIALIDSDNILPNSDWLIQMLKPLLVNTKIIGSEPIRFTYRRHSGFIERYSALIGANDPYAFVTGVYDRYSYISNKWTNLKVPSKILSSYTLLTLKPNTPIPTIGANGTIFRTEFLKNNLKSEYLFDIDIISQVLTETVKPLLFAKVDTGIIHTFCESSIKKFYQKQKRRLTDYYNYKHLRTYNWNNNSTISPIKFLLYSFLIIPSLIDTTIGFLRKPDPAWFFHPLACIITSFVYLTTTIKYKLNILGQVNRVNWKQ